MSSNVYNVFYFLFRCFINLFINEAVLNIIAQTSDITKLLFMRWKARNPMSSPIREHENNRFWLFRGKFVIVEAVLNIIVQATAVARVFFYIKVWKMKEKLPHIAQNIAETSQKYFQSFVTDGILSQHFCQILKNIALQLYYFNFLKYF